MRYNILIAEDDPDLIDMLVLYIDRQDFSIIRAMDGEEALEQFRNTKIDLALVDIMMPKMNGLELVKQIRKESNIPIIILSAKSADTDKVMGLNIGADAYVTKPFNPFEVVAYMKAALRRFYELGSCKDSECGPRLLINGDLEMEPDTFTLRKKGNSIALTCSEYKILAIMMRTPGRVFTKIQLCEALNGSYFENDDNTVMVHISNLRSKIEDDPSHPRFIKTVRGVGYRFDG